MMSLWITVGYIVIHDNIDIDGVKICKLRAVNLFSSAKEIYAKRSRHASKPKFKKPNLLQSGHLGVGGATSLQALWQCNGPKCKTELKLL